MVIRDWPLHDEARDAHIRLPCLYPDSAPIKWMVPLVRGLPVNDEEYAYFNMILGLLDQSKFDLYSRPFAGTTAQIIDNSLSPKGPLLDYQRRRVTARSGIMREREYLVFSCGVDRAVHKFCRLCCSFSVDCALFDAFASS